ncbi:MAG: hypothetical protein LIO86_09370 [Lachnospiraceae bacterium]|nr:hypothetical protein [Lachnospiraceae bacterium]
MSDGNYGADRRFGDSFMPEVKAILGQFLLRDDFVDEDKERNTDLIVLQMEAKRIGVRIQRYGYLKQYGDEFTIRYQRQSGYKTEYQKIIEGWGDYFFYGFADANGFRLGKWFIGDYNAFRKFAHNEVCRYGINALKRRMQVNNFGNGSSFLAYRKDEISDFVVADSESWLI